MNPIESNERFLEQLKRHEGEKRDKVGRHVAYRCSAGKLTIGWGHNLDANPIPNSYFSDGEQAHEGSVITNETAEKLLRQDVAACAKQLDLYMYWWRRMSMPRQGVLLNMCFNMGIKTLKTFEDTLGAMKKGDYTSAAYGMLDSRWAKQVKGRAKELALQMRDGVWIGADFKPVGGAEDGD